MEDATKHTFKEEENGEGKKGVKKKDVSIDKMELALFTGHRWP